MPAVKGCANSFLRISGGGFKSLPCGCMDAGVMLESFGFGGILMPLDFLLQFDVDTDLLSAIFAFRQRIVNEIMTSNLTSSIDII